MKHQILNVRCPYQTWRTDEAAPPKMRLILKATNSMTFVRWYCPSCGKFHMTRISDGV